ncbi:hypothetical protein X975_00426, partial [Stegodyphus mimosarum]
MIPKEEFSTYFEISQATEVEDLPENAWKVRPCEWYKEEFKDCRSIRARMHQYFVYGESIDCSQWKTDYQNCMLFRNKKDIKALQSVIDSEDERVRKRKEVIKENDVWTYRSEPPENWNSAMPDWMAENKKNSLLIETQSILNKGLTP